jgi:hypothetical protein
VTAIARTPYSLTRNGYVPAAPAAATAGAVRVCELAAAKYLGITYTALKDRRRRGTAPAWYWHMGRIAYDVTVLQAYAAQRGTA